MAEALATAACVEPGQYGGPIPVDHAGVTARFERLCGMTEHTKACAAVTDEADAAVAPEPDAAPAPPTRPADRPLAEHLDHPLATPVDEAGRRGEHGTVEGHHEHEERRQQGEAPARGEPARDRVDAAK